jgi:hypothetical protein
MQLNVATQLEFETFVYGQQVGEMRNALNLKPTFGGEF